MKSSTPLPPVLPAFLHLHVLHFSLNCVCLTHTVSSLLLCAGNIMVSFGTSLCRKDTDPRSSSVCCFPTHSLFLKKESRNYLWWFARGRHSKFKELSNLSFKNIPIKIILLYTAVKRIPIYSLAVWRQKRVARKNNPPKVSLIPPTLLPGTLRSHYAFLHSFFCSWF